jgi:cell fate regulator YaaT (PSP1 superfamily)
MQKYMDPDIAAIPEIVEVQFKSIRKVFCKNPKQLSIKVGDKVVVQCATGYDIGFVSISSDLVRLQMKKRGVKADSEHILNISRIAHEKDRQNWEETKKTEYTTMIKARQIAKDLNLQMKFNDVEFQADRKKVTLYYTAEGRVDFRELIKVFAKTFKTKIEMKQIGIRQESGRLGGIGDCGRELCCSAWLNDFTTVPTIAAKQQNLYLNPAKLSGQCSRLKCCLNYELDSYLEAFESFPDESIELHTSDGTARVFKIDILKGWMWFINRDSNMSSPFPMHINNVKKVLSMNQKKQKPDISKYIEKIEVEASPGLLDY